MVMGTAYGEKAMRRVMVAILSLGWIGISLQVATAAEIARWNSTDADSLAGTYGPVATAENVVVGNLVASAALSRSGAPAANTFAAAGYSASSSNGAMSAGHYWETVIQPEDGYGISFEKIVYRMRSPASGPKVSQWAYSLDGSTFIWLLPNHPVQDNYTNDRDVDISGVLALQGVTGPVWFRLFAWDGSSAASAWGVFGRENVLTFSGSLVSLSGPPAVSFAPSQDVQVHVSNTLEVAVNIFPPESDLQNWSFLPPPAGAHTLSGGHFTFTPASADYGTTFALSVVATNSYGATTGTVNVTVLEYLPPGTLIITFENAGEEKSSYDPGPVTLSGYEWILDQARIGTEAADVKLGYRAARFGSLYPAFMTSTEKILPAGMGTISFLYAKYSTSLNGAEIVIEISADTNVGPWLEVGRINADGVDQLTPYETTVRVNEPVYVRFRNEFASEIGQVNVDNIIIRPYSAPVRSPYEAFLLQYNVTPGDPGTEPNDDYDGDGFTNQQEFEADTNPYDPAIHP